jgi:hypothetical protein
MRNFLLACALVALAFVPALLLPQVLPMLPALAR